MTKTMNLQSHTLLLIITLLYFSITLGYNMKPDHSNNNNHSDLVFKKCKNQTVLASSLSHSSQQALSTLFQQLLAESSHSKYFRTTIISKSNSYHNDEDEDEDESSSLLFGLFQCRLDISNEACRSCMTELQGLHVHSNAPCNESLSGRVHLHRCYVRYEPYYAMLFEDVRDHDHEEAEFLHKTCGESSGDGTVVSGFVEMRDAAFLAIEEEIVTTMTMSNNGLGRGGFWKTGHGSAVQVAAQCEGETEACECGECVGKAAEVARDECGGAFSGEIYLDKCFITYSYDYAQGQSGNEGNGIDGKTVAIILGGAAALGFGFIFVLFIKSCSAKKDDNLV